MSTHAAHAATLSRHDARRAQGVPTVSVLVGPVGLGLRAWRSWACAEKRTVSVAGEGDFLLRWVADAFTSDPFGAAMAWVAHATGRDADELARATRYDLDQLRQALPCDPDSPAPAAAFAVLRAGAQPDPAAFVRELAGDTRVVRGLCGLFPDGVPALLLLPPAGTSEAAWATDVLRRLEPIVVAAPRVPVAVALSPAAYAGLLADHPGSRLAALAREGHVEVRGVSGKELEGRLRAAGIDPPVPSDTVERLTTGGLAEEVAGAFVEAARAVRSPSETDLASDFRSVHEGFLFEQLESLPRTAGLFRPNQTLPFRHGSRFAEADLLAADLKLVVELDGGFYHLTPDQFRRDRRKDWEYQRHEYAVLRFLAEDVVEDLPFILNTIADAVELRRRPPDPRGDA